MKTISIKILLVLLIFNLSSCKKDSKTSTLNEFKFSDKTQTINCTSADSKLLNEAIYSFENDVASFYDVEQRNVIRAYNNFMRQAISPRNKPALEEFASEHSVNIAKVLSDSGLFTNNGMNYNNDIIKCIAENMSTVGLKTTFNALLSTNSMRKELYEPALAGKASNMEKDKYLGLYIALQYFYSEINKIDFSQIDYEKRDAERAEKAKPITPVAPVAPVAPNNSKVDFNRRPAK